MKTTALFISSAVIVCLLISLVLPAHSQSFSVDTTVTPDGPQYDYTFVINYDQAGTVLGLTDPIYDWTFYMDPAVPAPTDVILPTGWKYTYDQTGGEFDFYTEGPNGFGSGDFGNSVIQPGQSLSGFGLTTAAAPDLSVAFATDEAFNQDANVATLPTTTPAPEPGAWAVLGVGSLAIGLLTVRRRRNAANAA